VSAVGRSVVVVAVGLLAGAAGACGQALPELESPLEAHELEPGETAPVTSLRPAPPVAPPEGVEALPLAAAPLPPEETPDAPQIEQPLPEVTTDPGEEAALVAPIRGKLVAEDGSPLAGYYVVLVDRDTDKIAARTKTTPAGEFAFPPVEASQYRIVVWTPEGRERFLQGRDE